LGFFDQPHFKTHLKRTGVIAKKKRDLSVKTNRELTHDPQLASEA
jgi:hypothetical protein